MLVVALFLSLALEPPVERLSRRGWRRGVATAAVSAGLVFATLGFLFAFGSVAVTQASQLVDNAPHYVREIVRYLNDDFGLHVNANSLIQELRSKNGAVHQLGRDLANSAPDIGLAVAKGTFQVIITFIFTFYLTADGPRLRRALCSRLTPERQEVVLNTWELAIDKTGSYLYSRSIQAVVCTAVVWGFFSALGVPSALALAIWVGIVSQFIPTVGTYVALVLPALVTLVNSPVDTVWVLLFLVGYQQFENYFLGPRIARFTLKIHPALTIGTVFAGALLFGAVGALLALPATAVIQALVSTYTEEHEVIETGLTAAAAPRGQPRRRMWRIIRRTPKNGTPEKR
jgi:predicted PurR-regulated permease PerM